MVTARIIRLHARISSVWDKVPIFGVLQDSARMHMNAKTARATACMHTRKRGWALALVNTCENDRTHCESPRSQSADQARGGSRGSAHERQKEEEVMWCDRSQLPGAEHPAGCAHSQRAWSQLQSRPGILPSAGIISMLGHSRLVEARRHATWAINHHARSQPTGRRQASCHLGDKSSCSVAADWSRPDVMPPGR
eukprot:210594-Chlamydomonas_euryale.AAC.2